MTKCMFRLLVILGAVQSLVPAQADEPARHLRKTGSEAPAAIPMRDADTFVEVNASSPDEVAERAESKLVHQAEFAGEVSALATVPPNDLCANAEPITGEGTFNFDNAMANQDGGAHSACTDPLESVGTLDHDVWYCWTSPCTGPVVIETCNQTTVDSKIAVYDGCTCPATSANLLGCNDDGCGSGSFLQSRRSFLAEMGQSYLLRVGTYPGDIGDPNNPGDDLPPALGGVGTFSLTCLTPPCNQPAGNCQEIKANAGSLSDRSTSLVADNFTPTSSGTISSVCWWGSYGSDSPPAVDSFRIRYFTNTAQNLPSASPIATFTQPGSLTVSGPVETVVFGAGFPIFEYSATHAGIALTGGQSYWVEISNVITGDVWYWQHGFGADRQSLQDGSKPGQITDVINGYTAGDQIGNDMAFCAGRPIVQPPPTSPCLTATNSCCAASATERGCNNQTCCEAVCACDPFCCNVTWDINCATVGLEGDCGAQVTCPGLCAGCPDGTFTFTNPAGCNVDAGEPHAIDNGLSPKGISQLTFTGPPGADNESCWSVSGSNQVQNIVDLGNGSFTMTLTGPMVTFTETQITYLSDTNVSHSTAFIAHPGNVDGGPTTNTADVTVLIDCCLRQLCSPAHGIYSCDIDRSGTSTAADATRLIDLLNGGNAFNLWNQTQKPASMVCP